MPKAKRKRKLATKVQTLTKSSLAGDEECGHDTDGDGYLGEDDVDFLKGLGEEGRLTFLRDLAPHALRSTGHKKAKIFGEASSSNPPTATQRKRRHSSSDEAQFESHPRPTHWEWKGEEDEEGVHYLLPLKSKRGLVQQPAIYRPSGEGDSESEHSYYSEEAKEDEEEQKNSEQEEKEAPPPLLTTASLFSKHEQKLTEIKERIAEIACLLVEDPEGNVDGLKKLRALCRESDPDVAITVRKLAMVSLMSVFKDITPSYHIRELTDAEKTVKVSKDVRKLRHFEQTLLQNYQQFLGLLDETVKTGLGEGVEGLKRKRRKERKRPLGMLEDGQMLSQRSMEGLAEVAVQCLCDLVVALSHFNFRSNILNVVVPRMNSKALQGKVSKMCCQAIQKLFNRDVVGEVSLEAVQLISKMVKAKGYKTKPAVLQTFLHLQLHHVDEPVGAIGNSRSRGAGKGMEEGRREGKLRMAKLNKKQRKRMMAEARLDRDLREAEAMESRQKKSKLQVEILKVVFLTYFRILKHSRHSPLLQPVLEGLGKFAHLISVDFFSDLMSVLHSLAETGGLSNRECMQCVLTAFEILSGQGSALNIDPRQFYTQLYGVILELNTCSSNENVLLAVKCLDKMMRKRRQISMQRVLGFVKRLSTVSLQLLPGACLAVMATIKQFMHSYSQCEQLLDVETVGGGIFRPDVTDPEMSQACSTSLWELVLFRKHYDPTVRTYATHLLSGAPSQGRESLPPGLARKEPQYLLTTFSEANSNPMLGVPCPPPHPSAKKKKKAGSSEFYYTDGGIFSDCIRHSELLANDLADNALHVDRKQKLNV